MVKTEKEIKEEKYCSTKKNWKGGGGCGAIYGIGLIASLIYFFQHLGTATFGNIVMAIINSFIWPGLLVYKALELLNF
jgi:hypothetical protein